MLCCSDVSPFHGAFSLLHFLILKWSERNTGGMKALFSPKRSRWIERNYLRLFLLNCRENYTPNCPLCERKDCGKGADHCSLWGVGVG